MDFAMEVHHVSKKYSRNEDAHLGYGLRDLFDEVLGRKRADALRKDEFFAVNDVSFTLKPGGALALIGRNGSGKTTLLKMLNGLTKPDAGSIAMRGRIQALINLGAGFNARLSGRDNVYNSASLMGMNRRETDAIYEAILDFSELEEFIDSPLQSYSSGMKARLGFAVAVHFKPDILLVDEILSVGDFAFQKKCAAKMEELRKLGVTFVFVSHGMNQVMQLCEQAIWLHRGRPMRQGPVKEVVRAYLEFLETEETQSANRDTGVVQQSSSVTPVDKKNDIYGALYDATDAIRDIAVEFSSANGESDVLPSHASLTVRYRFFLTREVVGLNVTLGFFRKDGLLITAISTLNGNLLERMNLGEVRGEVHIPDLGFAPGDYVLVLPIHEGLSYLYRGIAKEFRVSGTETDTPVIKEFRYEYRVQDEVSSTCPS